MRGAALRAAPNLRLLLTTVLAMFPGYPASGYGLVGLYNGEPIGCRARCRFHERATHGTVRFVSLITPRTAMEEDLLGGTRGFISRTGPDEVSHAARWIARARGP
jgi:hypothetical protein